MARFANTIDNQPIYAARAEADKNGDRIDTTYAKLTDIPDVPVQDVEVDGTSVVNAQGVAEITMPTVPTATSDLTNDSGFITASDVPAAQSQSDWEESDSSNPSYIQNKPDLSIYAQSANLATVATTGDYGDLLNTPTIPAAQVQSDWTEADSTSKAYIQHKPDLSVYAQSSSLATVATTGDYDDLVNKPSIPAAQVNSDWNAASGVAQILNKPNLATVATSGNYNDLSNLPTIPPAVTVDQHYDALSSNPQSGTAVAEALSGTGQVPTVTSSDDSKVLMASYSGGQGSYSWQPTAAATQVNSDWDATSGVAQILNKPDLSVYAETADLATVATTGSYNDLTDKPSIPAAQVNADWNAVSGVAQILNKPTIPAAQVQSNWSEADSTSKAYIQNKPDLSVYAQSSSLATVATTGDYDDLVDAPTIVGLAAGANVTITEANNTVTIAATDTTYTAGNGISISGGAISNSDPIPSHTSTQSGKVLGVDSNGDLDWVTPAASQVQANWNESDSSSPAFIQNKPTIPTVDQFFNPASTNAQSGTAVAGALSTISQVPPTSQASAGDVLTVDQYGDAAWVAPSAQAQVQADWTESDPTEVSYIQHKPNQKPLVAGQNVVLTESANNITIDCTASGGGSTYTAGNGISISAQDVISVDTSVVATQTDLAGKQNTLTAGSNVSIVNNVISATDTTYSAGTGIDITNNVISATGTTYTAGDGIDISNSEISVNYDSDTLEMQQTPPVTHESYLTSYNSSGMSNETYGETPVDMIDQIGTVPVTVSIPGNTFYTWSSDSQYAVIIFKTNYNDYPSAGAYCATPLSSTQDPMTGKYWLDEQDVVITTLVGNATPNYFTFGFNDGYLSSDVWNCDTTSLSDPIIFSYSTPGGAPELAVKNPLPASSVSDANKVLKVNSSGVPAWSSAQAPISAGTGIDITNNVVSVDTSVVATQTDLASKQDTLTAGTNVSITNNVISATDTTYSAGNGIDITNNVVSVDTSVVATQSDLADKEDAFDVGTGLEMDTSGATPTLQVEAPVDIVAGPGIVIDNPDGNTMRVSTEADAETVLFEDTGSTGTLVANVVLSESSTHFSKLEITLGWAGGGGSPVPGRLIFTCIPDGKGYGFAGFIGKDASAHHIIGGISTNGTTLAIINCLDMYTSNNSNVTYQSFAGALKVFKVVGIHRIANN